MTPVTIPAFPITALNQYSQTLRKPAKSPNASRAKTYGPPVRGYRAPRFAYTRATPKYPIAVRTHAMIPSGPIACASDAGSVYIDVPTMLPTTRATAPSNETPRTKVAGADGVRPTDAPL